ncbi:peptidoglycan DD-metalloendopeptidase family protein [Heliorestis convoluta]|uniref:Peptidase M23 n=1 Tax=Heliorestis convoluta TaxID=356322 RepID=A0A5Q2MX77_9FIRM|nr:M23 family metallopeptidase [Heliorestis convoluta]QGG47087.1 Peptidase M23 [Heliorestis convoluta]
MEPTKKDSKGAHSLFGLFVASLLVIQLLYPVAGESYVNNDTLLRLLKGEPIIESLPLQQKENVAAITRTFNIYTLSDNESSKSSPSTTNSNPITSAAASTSRATQAHKVVRGDTLTHIARQYDMTLDELITLNSLNPRTFIQPGQLIMVKTGAESTSKSTNNRNQLVSRGAVLSTMQPPLQGRITSPFGPRNNAFHHGVDIAGDTGDPIRAVQAGQVAFAGWKPIYGQTVIIEHPHNVKTLYAHASRILVRVGQEVERGQTVALVGATGVSTGPHLHLEIHIDEKAVNPLAHIRSLGR